MQRIELAMPLTRLSGRGGLASSSSHLNTLVLRGVDVAPEWGSRYQRVNGVGAHLPLLKSLVPERDYPSAASRCCQIEVVILMWIFPLPRMKGMFTLPPERRVISPDFGASIAKANMPVLAEFTCTSWRL